MSQQTENSKMVPAGMSRRDIIKNLRTAAGVATILPSVFVQGASTPNNAAAKFMNVCTYSAPHFATGGKGC